MNIPASTCFPNGVKDHACQSVVGSNARSFERWADTLNVGLRFSRAGAEVTRGSVPQLPPAQQCIPWEHSSDRLQDTALELVNF
jgi:hypothetical protein